MLKYIGLILTSIFVFTGCKSTSVNNSNVETQNVSTNQVVSIRYDKYTGEFYYDHWDYFIQGVKNGTVVFTWPKAIFVYLISNVQIFDSRPECTDVDLEDSISVTVIIFRWSF